MGATVLIADGDRGFRDFVRRLLGSAADVVGEAVDADQVVRMAGELRPSLVFVDVDLPGGGLAAIRRIKAERAETRVVLLTAHNEEAYLDATGKSGADELLPKRSVLTELLFTVRSLEPARLVRAGCAEERRPRDTGRGWERRRTRPSE